MDGLSATWVLGIPLGSIVLALLGFPIVKLSLRAAEGKQRALTALLAALSVYLFCECWQFVFLFFGFFAGPLAYIPLGILLFSCLYFSYRLFRPGDFRHYRLGRAYKFFASVVGVIALAMAVLHYFPPSDQKFVSPDGDYEVYAYTGGDFGITRFKLYDKAGALLGKTQIETGGVPNRSGGARWHADHVALDYMCTGGDCHPTFLRLDGKTPSVDDRIRFEKMYRGN